ncbi:MAG: acetyl-CoA acetyltransferase [Pseudomonadota bacterium]
MGQDEFAIIGAGHTPFGRLKGETLEDLVVSAGAEAIADAGLTAADIDAVYLGHFNSGMVTDGFASSLIHQISPDLRFKPATRLENACASGSAAIHAGISSIASGDARIVLVVGAEKMTARSTKEVTDALAGAGYQNTEEEAGLSFPHVFSLAAQAYTERYQDPLHAMAQIASKNHENALRNPLAQMRKSFSVEECDTVSDNNPVIAPPLRLTDCSLISDGAAALVITTSDVAKTKEGVSTFRSRTHVSDYLPMASRDFAAFEGPELAIRRALRDADLQLSDLDFAEVHDCFTIAELLIYEAMGLAPKGEGARALEDGVVYRDGALPVNLSGGLKAKGHPVGATGVSMHAIAHRQLTDAAGDLQLPDAKLGLVFNMGGAGVASYASILQAR